MNNGKEKIWIVTGDESVYINGVEIEYDRDKIPELLRQVLMTLGYNVDVDKNDSYGKDKSR